MQTLSWNKIARGSKYKELLSYHCDYALQENNSIINMLLRFENTFLLVLLPFCSWNNKMETRAKYMVEMSSKAVLPLPFVFS